ncbi:uncharacterized protein DNG_00443 [Cephalotrichum gorgonifer]|uniref:RNB domain-containing protein n=1 Tax=Cephalotrichum gorgonifer TaxID=2041049 RepID=A0AAE8MQE0_9PEZI|nr:uncharacterized protein DNG_00443 [Cephalotrichum gorgonifer]
MLRIAGRQTRCLCLCRPVVNGPLERPESHLYDRSRGPGGSQQRSYALPVKRRPNSKDRPRSDDFLEKLTRTSTIRETLRQWEADNPQVQDYSALPESVAPGQVPNNMFKSQALSGMREARQVGDEDDGEMAAGESGPAEDTMSAPTDHLRPGTLVEIRVSDARIPILAVILGRFCGVYYFYTNGGQLVADDRAPPVLFSVANFASAAEIKTLVDLIPKDRPLHPREVTNNYQPSLEIAAPLSQKILSFSTKASLLLQENMAALSAADRKIPHATEFITRTLHEMTRALLPNKEERDGGYSPEILYAVHTSLLNDDVDTFRPLNKIDAGKHVSYLYRVSPASTARIIRKVRTQVRHIMETLGKKSSKDGDRFADISNPLWKFLVKARYVVKESRTNRAWTDHGTLAPHRGRYPIYQDWTDEEKEFIHFIEIWVGSHVHRESSLHCMGSAILHLTGMYKPARQLNAAAGWVFLQELGWIPSWELPTRHQAPIPGARVQRGGGYIRPSPGPYKESMREDIAANYRKDWGPLKAYCIDATSTTLLDDAVSVEPAETPGEYWLHTHVADPTAFIDPKSKLAEFAAIMGMDHFIQGYRCSMFPEDFYDEVIMKKLSLDKGRPCLTFSTKVNDAGEVLDMKVQPGTLQNLIFLDPDDVDTFCPPIHVNPAPERATTLLVGPSQDNQAGPARKMSTVKDLSPDEKSDLQTMHRLLNAVDAIRVKRGAISQPRSAQASVQVTFDGEGGSSPADPATWAGDPTIEVGFEDRKGDTLVSMSMLLAGESVARWCNENNIPVPYHTQPGALRNPKRLQALAGEIRELTDKGEPVPAELWRRFDAEVGPTAQSVDAEPVVPLGLLMYTKVTSPLRRLSDCIVHWQIHAALQQLRGATTANSKRPGRAAVDPALLPWPKAELKSKLESLRLSAFTSQSLSRRGSRPWKYQALLRAWRFGEAPLPRSFTFTVSSVYGHLLVGELDYLSFRAVLRKGDLEGVALMKEVADGDVLEVEIADVDVYGCCVFVKAVRRLGGGGEGAPVVG